MPGCRAFFKQRHYCPLGVIVKCSSTSIYIRWDCSTSRRLWPFNLYSARAILDYLVTVFHKLLFCIYIILLTTSSDEWKGCAYCGKLFILINYIACWVSVTRIGSTIVVVEYDSHILMMSSFYLPDVYKIWVDPPRLRLTVRNTWIHIFILMLWLSIVKN